MKTNQNKKKRKKKSYCMSTLMMEMKMMLMLICYSVMVVIIMGIVVIVFSFLLMWNEGQENLWSSLHERCNERLTDWQQQNIKKLLKSNGKWKQKRNSHNQLNLCFTIEKKK